MSRPFAVHLDEPGKRLCALVVTKDVDEAVLLLKKNQRFPDTQCHPRWRTNGEKIIQRSSKFRAHRPMLEHSPKRASTLAETETAAC